MPTLQQLIRNIFARRSLVPPLVQPQWTGQHHASPARAQRRKIIAHLGRRQGIRWIKHVRAQQRANRAELAQLS
jgi:hypothetical protein